MSELVIKVNKTNILKGHRESISHCPIARRLHAMGFPRVEVTGSGIWFAEHWHSAEAIEVELPEDVYAFIRDFDSGKSMEPTTLKLDVPDKVLTFRRRGSR